MFSVIPNQEFAEEKSIMINIAIDGPSGAGKSTIARAAAKELGFVYIDTGALYRTVGLFAAREGVDLESADEIAAVLEKAPDVKFSYVDGEQRMFLNGEDVSREIRTPESSMAASAVSAVPAVREYLFDLQKKMARENNCIMDGRDIGTVVLPDAQIKIFLTASAEARAERRASELREKGMPCDYEQVLADINQRDYNDTHREIAPLKQAEDAILLDTSGNELEQSVELVLNTIRTRL